ncbi:MAG: type III-A CRISPR-associated RAMP protein Csm4 [Bacteroidaceae bacterium]|nr:type III-A CRISPR-associated RAMP protein Csm4 [Bacteroidaceae bacterium]
MERYHIYKLHFTTPLHLGDSRDGYDVSLKTIHSDTMYAAITSALAKMGYEIPNDGDLGVAISSLFPFYQQGEASKALLFFPKPVQQKLPQLDNVAEAKKVKKVNWVDKHHFERLLAGKDLLASRDARHVHGEFLTDSDVIQGAEQDGCPFSIMKTQVSHRVTLDRQGMQDAQPFYMDRVYFEDYSGLFFMAQGGNTHLIEKALNLLSVEGIGTDRAVGNGLFEWSQEEIALEVPASTDYSLGLSVFIPESQEQLIPMMQGDGVAYELLRRGGWITTPPYNTIRKNAIYAFAPGSIFSGNVTDGKCGAIVNLTPKYPIDHPVWRCGKSLFLPIKLN